MIIPRSIAKDEVVFRFGKRRKVDLLELKRRELTLLSCMRRSCGMRL